jgi:hypothetical protein
MADALQKISQLQGGDVGKFAVSISKFWHTLQGKEYSVLQIPIEIKKTNEMLW